MAVLCGLRGYSEEGAPPSLASKIMYRKASRRAAKLKIGRARSCNITKVSGVAMGDHPDNSTVGNIPLCQNLSVLNRSYLVLLGRSFRSSIS